MKLSPIGKLHMRHRFWRYRYKSEVPDIRYVLESRLEGKTLLDIGANIGIYSYYLSRKAGPHGKVYAFEAQPELGSIINFCQSGPVAIVQIDDALGICGQSI